MLCASLIADLAPAELEGFEGQVILDSVHNCLDTCLVQRVVPERQFSSCLSTNHSRLMVMVEASRKEDGTWKNHTQ